MSLIDQKPSDLPSTNELDKIPDDAAADGPAEIRLGQAVLMTLLDPPEVGSYIDISARLYIKHEGFDQNTPDSPKVPVRQAKLIVAWPLGEQMPKPKPKKKTKAEEDAEAEAAAADEQPALFENDEDDADGEDPDGGWDTEDDDAALFEDDGGEEDPEDDEDNVVPFEGGPAFSDGGE